jgi:hypothetical protein
VFYWRPRKSSIEELMPKNLVDLSNNHVGSTNRNSGPIPIIRGIMSTGCHKKKKKKKKKKKQSSLDKEKIEARR